MYNSEKKFTDVWNAKNTATFLSTKVIKNFSQADMCITWVNVHKTKLEIRGVEREKQVLLNVTRKHIVSSHALCRMPHKYITVSRLSCDKCVLCT